MAFSPDGTRIVTGSADTDGEGVGRADGHGPARPQGAHGRGVERGVQPGRHADRHRQCGPDGEGVGRTDGPGIERRADPTNTPAGPDQPGRPIDRPRRRQPRRTDPAATGCGGAGLSPHPHATEPVALSGRLRRGAEGEDDFAARFYLNLLPPPEQTVLEAEAAAEWEIAAGRTQDAIAHLVTVSTANPEDTSLALKLAALQAWFGRDKELDLTRGRALEFAKSSFSRRMGSHGQDLQPAPHTGQGPAGTCADTGSQGGEINKNAFTYRLTLGMAE